MNRRRILSAFAVIVFAGCSAAAQPSGASRSLTVAGSQPVPEPTASPSHGAIGLPASVIDPVVDDAARVTGVASDRITVVYAQPQTFPDGGLGCPEPGMLYPQVQVDGYRIVVDADGDELDYRGTGSTFRQCDPKASPGAS
jgi:hypothetical protein